MARRWWILFCACGFIGVSAGAFGAHALRETLAPDRLSIFETGVRYLFYHLPALFAVGWFEEQYGRSPTSEVVGGLFALGILLFTGSLWALSLSGIRGLGAITPLGGLSFLAGWIGLGLLFARAPGPFARMNQGDVEGHRQR